MISISEIGDIMYQKVVQVASELGITDVRREDNMGDEEVTSERAVIILKPQDTGNIWLKGYVEVNFCTPDIKREIWAGERLKAIERVVLSYFRWGEAAKYDGTPYNYYKESHSLKHDKQLRCGYVNLRIRFEVLNVLE